MPRLLATILALSAALSGCVSIADESARQLDEIGDVELTTVICASRANAGVDCPPSNMNEVTNGGDYQVLIAYRLPAQASPPESIAATDVPLTLSRSASYTAELERLAPVAGQRWAGYVSPAFNYQTLQSEQAATVVARMMLLRGPDGEPFPAPFRYRAIVGYRQAGEDPNRPVRCGPEVYSANGEDGNTNCMTYPPSDELEASVAVPTRDLGILAGASGSVPRGGSGAIGFTVAYSGETPGPSVALAATTTVPGGTVATAAPAIAPSAAGSTVVPVTVTVPASTAPGTYEVTLSARHPNGQTRQASGLVTITGSGPVDRTPPEVAMRMRSKPRVKRALRVGMVADVSCSEPCRLTAHLRAGRRTARALAVPIPAGQRAAVVGTVAEKRHAAGRRNVRIRFRRGLGPRLKRMRRVPLALRVTALDRAGNVRRRTISFALRR